MVNTEKGLGESKTTVKGRFIQEETHTILGNLQNGDCVYIDPRSIIVENKDGLWSISTKTIVSKEQKGEFTTYVKRNANEIEIILEGKIRLDINSNKNYKDQEKQIKIHIPEKNIYTSWF